MIRTDSPRLSPASYMTCGSNEVQNGGSAHIANGTVAHFKPSHNQ
jgi:hypothetical protein